MQLPHLSIGFHLVHNGIRETLPFLVIPVLPLDYLLGAEEAFVLEPVEDIVVQMGAPMV